MGSDLDLRGAGKPNAPATTLCAMFDQSVGNAPERVALRHLGVTLTYRKLGRAVSTLAQRLAELVVPGEVVALLLPNSIEFQVAYFGALKALATPALLNPLYPEVQLSPLLRAASARRVLCAPATYNMVAPLARNLGIHIVCLGQDITVQDLVADATKPTGLRASSPEDIGALLFSGGTTGLPKAVEHTHGRLVTAVRGMEHIWPTRTDGEVFLPVAPFTHVYGFLQGVLVPLSACGETVIPERFKPDHIVELFERHQVTFLAGGPKPFMREFSRPPIWRAQTSLRSGCRPLAARLFRLSSWSAGGEPPGSRSTRATACRKSRRSVARMHSRALGRARSESPCRAPKCRLWISKPDYVRYRRGPRASYGFEVRT